MRNFEIFDILLWVIRCVTVEAGKYTASDTIREFDENTLFVRFCKFTLEDEFDDSMVQLPAAVRDDLWWGRHSKLFDVCVGKVVRQLSNSVVSSNGGIHKITIYLGKIGDVASCKFRRLAGVVF